MSNILWNRFTLYIKEVVGEYQARFMLRKSIIDQIQLVKEVDENITNSIRMYIYCF